MAREINWAKRQNLIADAEDQLLEKLVPKALKAFETALDNNDTQAALELFKGLNIFRKQSVKPIDRPAPEVQEESLEFHIKRISKGGATANLPGGTGHSPARGQIAAAGAASVDKGSLLEGVIVERSTEESASSVVPDGDENRTANPESSVGAPANGAGLQN